MWREDLGAEIEGPRSFMRMLFPAVFLDPPLTCGAHWADVDTETAEMLMLEVEKLSYSFGIK